MTSKRYLAVAALALTISLNGGFPVPGPAVTFIGASAAQADTLLNLIDAPGQTNTPFSLPFTVSSLAAAVELTIAGYQVPSFEQTTQIGLFLNGIGPNLLGSNWDFEPAPSGSNATTFNDGSSVPGLNFGGTVVGSFDTFSQTIEAVPGASYSLNFLYSNSSANAPSGLLASAAISLVPSPIVGAGLPAQCLRWPFSLVATASESRLIRPSVYPLEGALSWLE